MELVAAENAVTGVAEELVAALARDVGRGHVGGVNEVCDGDCLLD